MKKLFKISVSDPHRSFVALRDKSHNIKRKEMLEEFWQQYEPFADRNFRSAFAHDPRSRFWEMCLACGLLNLKFQLLKSKERGEAGPDICILNNEKRIWIEAVAPTGGTGPDLLVNPPLNKAFYIPDDKVVLRLCSGIKNKLRQLDDYLHTLLSR